MWPSYRCGSGALKAADTHNIDPTSVIRVNGLGDEEYGPDDFRPVPHPDDRLWRHPAEIAAMHAAAQAARDAQQDASEQDASQEIDAADLDDTVELFAPEIPAGSSAEPPRQQRVHAGLLAAAVVVLVGASAIAVGALSTRTNGQQTLAASSGQEFSASAVVAEPSTVPSELDDLAIAADNDAETLLASRIHDEVAGSLPRIQAATADGMREGGGLFINNEGLFVTSAGLVSGVDYVIAWTADGRRWPATMIAKDAVSDVAIFSIDAETTKATFRQEAHLWSGQYALAIDHSNRTMSLGEVQSLVGTAGGADHKGDQLAGDPSSRIVVAPHVPAGSAIVDDTGSVIGMANLATTDMTTATPAWMLERVVHELVNAGSAHHSWLGAEIEPGPDASAGHVTSVFSGSPAEVAGLRSGDIIDSVDGEPLSTNMSLWTMVQMQAPGDSVDLAVTRHGERRLISVTLDTWISDN